MPVKLVDEKELKSIKRLTPIVETSEWQEILANLHEKEKLPQGKALQITLSEKTIQILNKKKLPPDEAKKRAVLAFRQRLINTFPHFRIRAVGGELAILSRK